MALQILKSAATALSRLFYPHLCAGCDTELTGREQVLCLHCVLALPLTGLHRHPENKVYRNFIGRLPLERATAFTYFTKEGMMQHLLHRLKYKGEAEIGHYLGSLFATGLQTDHWLEGIDLLVPVPLHRRKARRRGFNQAALIARGMAEISGLPVAEHAMIRVKDTGSQTRKSRPERLANVDAVFCVKQAEQVRGKHLLLVDDVLTTGATLEAVGLALLAAGAGKLSLTTLAMAGD